MRVDIPVGLQLLLGTNLLALRPWHQMARPRVNRRRASVPSIESILLQVQLRRAGHVTRMEDVRMPKAVFFSELQEGKRDCGAQESVTKIS